MANKPAGLRPGDVTFVDTVAGQKFEPAYTVDVRGIQAVGESIQQLKQVINESFYADLWTLIANIDRTGVTAEEVKEKKEEKLILLGPVLERLQNELEAPVIERYLGVLFRRGYLPPPPPELQGQDIRIEYTSVLAQAQKQAGLAAVNTLLQTSQQMAQLRPETVDNLNVDEITREVAAMAGTKPSLVHTAEEVAAMRQQRAQAQQQQQQAQQMAMAAKGAKDLAGADMSGDNGLTRLTNALGPVAAAQANGGVQ
jgi:hypothetical protein